MTRMTRMSDGNPFIPKVKDWDRASANSYNYGGVAKQKDAPDLPVHRHPVYGMNASGDQEQWDTGAVRDSQDGKARYDLIDPGFLLRFAEHMRKGAEHYGEHNWTMGIPSSRYLASLMRHVEAYRRGERDEDHLAAIAFNVMGIMRNEGTELDDQFDWTGAL